MADEFDDGLFPEEQSDDIEETAGIFDDDYDELDEIVLEEGDARSNRPFILSILGLLGIAVLAPLCLVISQLSGFISEPTPSADVLTYEAEFAVAVATNDAIATLNAYVTQTIDARNATSTAIANQPTETPTPTITPTPSPTNTAVPDTAEEASAGGGETEGAEDPDAADDESSLGDSDRTTSDNVDGSTDETSSDASSDSSSSDASGSNSGVTDENTTSANSDSTAADTSGATAAAPEQLPETGFSMAGTIALAFGLLVLLFGARRLRQT
ncbi:MAG: hypothetical protein AAF902_07885 [Chloroflexota bacterium]